ncbi:hypothetical protein BpHYR1_052357 [Brachionus plicatilis]|uniref:Uncharacterized protein n=1 Tax=Brachionus plicatilis TaxID=10195 RepID=A0A3M7T1H5_BRAPC|nr:hypothetical protein BpHYR1_052357 [Brachionus plicatilis]
MKSGIWNIESNCSLINCFYINMHAILYREKLSDYLLRFGASNYDLDFKLHQDNDPKHLKKWQNSKKNKIQNKPINDSEVFFTQAVSFYLWGLKMF